MYNLQTKYDIFIKQKYCTTKWFITQSSKAFVSPFLFLNIVINTVKRGLEKYKIKIIKHA